MENHMVYCIGMSILASFSDSIKSFYNKAALCAISICIMLTNMKLRIPDKKNSSKNKRTCHYFPYSLHVHLVVFSFPNPDA